MDKKKVIAPLVCHGHSRPVVDLFYSPIMPDGFFLVSASKDSTPMLRNGETGDWIGTFQGHKGAVWSCCLDKHALRTASASADFSAKLWDALTGDELHSFEHKHIVCACAFSEDTHFLLTGGMEKILRIYDLNRPDAPPQEIEKSPGSVRTISWLHSDQTILGSCTDVGGVRLWDVRTSKIVRTLETKSSVTSAEVSRDGLYITTADGSTIKFWDANHFGLIKSYDMPCIVESASLEPKYGNKFIAGGEDMWVHVFDFHTGEEVDQEFLQLNTTMAERNGVNCNCGQVLRLNTSWTNNNPGRRFLTCPVGQGGCGAFIWDDPPMCERSRIIIPGLLHRINKEEATFATLQNRIRVLYFAVGFSWFLLFFVFLF